MRWCSSAPSRPTRVEELIVDFVGNLSAAGAVTGTFDRTAQLLSQLLPPKQVEALMEEIKGSASRSMWQRLSHIDPEVLANYLRNEYPQTVAVILSRIRAGPRRARALHPAGRVRGRRRQPHAQDGERAEGGARAYRGDAQERVRHDGLADVAARRAQDHGGGVQRLRPPHRGALPVGARPDSTATPRRRSAP